ncbi:MAG: DUF4349 domain-containing protein [Defluviitaleaceae bacterium]|nr:DUF4349 domain-containing protein [Defluviitaleaceae bacterium]
MRLFIGCALFAVCCLFFTLPVSAQNRPVRQTYTIEIEVECIEAATEFIRELNGYNLTSNVFLQESTGWGAQRRANFTRRVDSWAFRQVQEALRGMGDVLSESENAVSLSGAIIDTEARLAAISQEIERLTMMMAASDSLQILITIDSRLSQVTWERNNLMGRRNVLLSEAASPVINIMLFEIPEDRPEPTPLGFGRRVADRFSNSWYNTRSSAASFLVFLIRISIPLVVVGIIAAICIVIANNVRKKWQRSKKVITDTSKDNENAIEQQDAGQDESDESDESDEEEGYV